MSPRAAWRLETLGFDAHDYVAGKQDWLAFGLPYEGHARLVGDLVTREVPTCGADERLDGVRDRLHDSRFGLLVVLNAEGVVLGRLAAGTHDVDGNAPVTALMQEGPTTVRPSEEVGALAERMRRAGVDGVLVTRSDGKLLGIFEREHGQQATT